MRIKKSQLRRLIREAINLPPADSGDFRTVPDSETDWGMGPDVIKDPKRPWGSEYVQKKEDSYSDVIQMSPNGDSYLVDGLETYIQDVPSQLTYASGFEMSDVDADNLIFALETQEQDGYVELGVEYKNGKWSW